jgi:hypothetical protein
MWCLVCNPSRRIQFPDVESSVLSKFGTSQTVALPSTRRLLLFFDILYLGMWSRNYRMLRRTVNGYFTVTNKLMLAVSESNVPNLHYAVHILIRAHPSGEGLRLLACWDCRLEESRELLPSVVSVCVCDGEAASIRRPRGFRAAEKKTR